MALSQAKMVLWKFAREKQTSEKLGGKQLKRISVDTESMSWFARGTIGDRIDRTF